MADPFAPQEPRPRQPAVPPGGWSDAPPEAGTPYASPPGTWSGQPVQAPVQPGTDGVSVAALVTGLLQTGPVAVVLGIIGLRRVSRSRRDGKGMAITGIVLGAITTVLGTIFAALVIGGVVHWVDTLDHGYGDNAALDMLWDGCAAGDMGACDDLYLESGFGTEYEKFGDTCGGRTDGGTYCRDLED